MASCFAWGVQAKGCASIGSEHGRACTVSQSLSASVAWGGGGCGADAEHSATAVGEEERRVVQKKQGGGASEQAAGQGEG